MTSREPTRPAHIPRYAEDCLKALAAAGLGHAISLGGAFGLLHYLDHRPTHDIDAWWSQDSSNAKRKQVEELIAYVLAGYGEVRKREWGDVCSLELLQESTTVFSFQIAERSVQLEDPVSTQWAGVQLDSLDDLIASKMVALVERGAPRDFVDIFAVCEADIATPRACWRLWKTRQARTGGSTSFSRARLAITTHLKRIELRRPLNSIVDQRPKNEAEKTRIWFRKEFLNAGMD